MGNRKHALLLFLALTAGAVSADVVSGPTLTPRSDLLAVLGWLVYAVCAFLIGVLSRADLKNVGVVLSIFLIGYGIFGLCCINNFLFGPLLVVVGLVSAGLGYTLAGRIRKAANMQDDAKLTKTVRVVLILFFVAVGLVAQFAIITYQGTSSSHGSGPGFSKIKPQLGATTIQADGNGTLTFTNGAGAAIDVTEVGITDILRGSPECVIGPDKIKPSNHIGPGENMAITDLPADCLKSGLKGDVYAIRVRINYNLSVGNIITSHIESGTLRGPLE